MRRREKFLILLTSFQGSYNVIFVIKLLITLDKRKPFVKSVKELKSKVLSSNLKTDFLTIIVKIFCKRALTITGFRATYRTLLDEEKKT